MRVSNNLTVCWPHRFLEAANFYMSLAITLTTITLKGVRFDNAVLDTTNLTLVNLCMSRTFIKHDNWVDS
jgi:hypothetical protein